VLFGLGQDYAIWRIVGWCNKNCVNWKGRKKGAFPL